jgi:acetyl-CoA carboxylase carboxyltransferase component
MPETCPEHENPYKTRASERNKKCPSRDERGKAINMASLLELDAVIDPAETRAWILRGLRSVPRADRGGRRRFVDTW